MADLHEELIYLKSKSEFLLRLNVNLLQQKDDIGWPHGNASELPCDQPTNQEAAGKSELELTSCARFLVGMR